MHGVFILGLVTPTYFLISYFITLEAVRHPYVHDIVELRHESANTAVGVLFIFYVVLALLSKPNYDVLFKRLALMAVLKTISQSITIVPQPLGVDECIDVSFWELKNCADMMFSGHTAFTYLSLYRIRFRYFFTFAMAVQLVMGDWHYMSDCFMAVIVAYAIEKYLPDEIYL